MTIREAIRYVDEHRLNAFPTASKVAWLSELDARIAEDILLMSLPDLQLFKYDPETDLDTELLVTYPHERLYTQFLAAKVDEDNGEYNRLANSSTLYNATYHAFACWILNTYDPIQGCDAPLEEY